MLELLVAMGVFMVLGTLALGIYTYTLKAESRAVQTAAIQSEAQLIMEVITKRVRSARVDYQWYDSYDSPGILDTPETKLALRDKNNNLIVFKLLNQSINACVTSNCAVDTDFAAISTASMPVTDLRFFIYPDANPFSMNEPPTESPRVTIVLELSYTVGVRTSKLTIEQTVPQRLGGVLP